MYKFLFSCNLTLAFTLAFIFLFIIPLFLAFFKKKVLISIYAFLYFVLLFIGVFLQVTLTTKNISFALLITNNWANNRLSLADFTPIGLVINIFLLFPLGYIYPFLKKKTNIFKVALLGFSIAFLIEFFQFLLPIIRYPEVLDVINNTISVILGYLYYKLLTKLYGGIKNDQLSQQKNSKYPKKRIYQLWKKRNES